MVQKYNKNGKTNFFIKIILWIIFSILCINLIGNILGKTLFEKIFMEIICLFQLLNIMRIIIDNKNIKRDYIINLIKQEYKK
jgi:succinate-acetate transporter protein